MMSNEKRVITSMTRSVLNQNTGFGIAFVGSLGSPMTRRKSRLFKNTHIYGTERFN